MGSIVRRLLTLGIVALIGGLFLMLAAPMLHSVIGTPHVAPGYWRCVLLVLVIRPALFACGRPLATS